MSTPQDDPLIGLTIARVRPMTTEEINREGWTGYLAPGETPLVIEFDDGSSLHAMRDPEGNGPGTLVHNVGLDSYYVLAAP